LGKGRGGRSRSPDHQVSKLVFGHEATATRTLRAKRGVRGGAPLDGSAPPKPLFETAAELYTSDFTHDGKGLLLTRWAQPGEVGEGHVGVWVLPVNGSGAPRRIIPRAMWPAVSPDGRWIAYVDREGSTLTPHVLRADGTGIAVPVADIPAREPRWARFRRRRFRDIVIIRRTTLH
jgi:hypothetical protein